jgi:thiol-disulfide isomerase/thioredoxin
MGGTQYVSTRRLRFFIRAFFLLIIIAAIIFTIYQVVQDKSTVSVGEEAPNFKLKTIDGKTVQLSDFRGQGVLLNFWASWCGPCKAEMPFIEEAKKENIKGVKIIAVNIRETPLVVRQYFNRHHLDFTTLLDRKGEVTETFNIDKIPSSYLIDKNGVVVKKVIGPMTSLSEVNNNLKIVQP